MTLNRTQIEETLTACLRKALLKEHIKIDPDASLRHTLGLDSMGTIEFIDMLEEAFDVSIDDDEVAQIDTLNDAIALAEKKMGS